MKWLKPDEAARHIGVSTQTLANWRWLGKGPQWHKAGGKVLYEQSDLDAFVLAEQPQEVA